MWVILFFLTCFLAYSNGANDNFKGVATLFGSHTTNYKKALFWGTVTTFLGSLFSVAIAGQLVKSFAGNGLLPGEVVISNHFLLAVIAGAGLTVILATLLGFPVSTTHALTGAIVGSGFIAVGFHLKFFLLWKSFFSPLLFSPLIAIFLGTTIYALVSQAKAALKLSKESCFCVGETATVIPQANSTLLLTKTMDITVATQHECKKGYRASIFGVNAEAGLNFAHFLSAGSVSFARGLNDTPKIIALFLSTKVLGMNFVLLAVAISMALGGILNAARVAETISHKITPLTHSEGFTANIVTAFLVIVASRLGLPVSTTHVSVGSLFGVGLMTKKANIRVMRDILFSWVATLPLAALLSASLYFFSNKFH